MSGDFGDHYTDNDFERAFTIKENGSYLIRFICSVKKVSRVWLPVLVPNEDNGYDESWRAFVVGNDTIFEELATCHINAQLQAGIKESAARSPFKDQPMHVYLIFNRHGDELKVEVGEFKWSVRKQLIDLQEKICVNRVINCNQIQKSSVTESSRRMGLLNRLSLTYTPPI